MFDWIDISLPLHPDMVHRSDEPPFQMESLQDRNGSDRANASRITMSSHTGTHIDAPVQVLEKEANLDALSFSATVGLARVIEIHDKEVVKLEELRRHRLFPHERILLKTKNPSHVRSSNFVKNEEWIYLDPSAAAWLAERRISTVGIDSLSIGGDKNYGTNTHRILLNPVFVSLRASTFLR